MKHVRTSLLVGAVAVAVCLPSVAHAQTVSPDSSASAAAASSAGWDLVMQDDFSGSSIDSSKWVVYGGEGRTRARENAFVGDGKLTLRTTRVGGKWKAAGVGGSRGVVQTYGKYEVRARFDAGYGVRAVALLWPTGSVWPPEVDFYEIASIDTQRRTNKLTLHHGPGHQMEHAKYDADFTQWHTVGVEWTPGMLRYTMDGRVMATMSGSNVPSRPMWLALQSGITGISARPDARTPGVVDYEIDWVKVYKRA